MITNSNGLLDNIYHYLWVKDESLLKESFKLRVPDTIVFKNSVPQVWYFTNKEGDLQMKKQESRTLEKIIQCFTKGIKQPGRVVAYYIYPERYNSKDLKELDPFEGRGKPLQLLDLNEKICIFYITQSMFPNFMQSNNKPPEGILQRFIEPLGNNEAVIQAIWSPSVCIMSKQQNHRDLYDYSYDPYERCTTFDGGEAYSRNIPLRGKEISQEIRKQCQMIVAKITNLSYGFTNISRIILYFKPDQQNKVWFLYSSSLRLHGELQSQIKQYQPLWGNDNVKKNNTPIAFTTNYCRPHQIRNTMTVNTMHPVKLIKDIECFECAQLCQQKDLYHLTYEFIIKHFEQNVNQNPLVNEIQVIQANKQFNPDKKYLRDIHSHIPPLIYKLYPQLTVAHYEQLKINDAFLIKAVLVCEQCFLMHSECNSSVSGAKHRIQQSRIKVRLQSASLLHQRPDIKDFLIETNKGLLQQKNPSTTIKTLTNSNMQSFYFSNNSTNFRTFSAKNKTSIDFQFDTKQVLQRMHTGK